MRIPLSGTIIIIHGSYDSWTVDQHIKITTENHT